MNRPKNTIDLMNLGRLMTATSGDPHVVVGIIDGPIDTRHPAFAQAQLETVPQGESGQCRNQGSQACAHGTAVAGILMAQRDSGALGICPACKFLIHPIFPDHSDDPAAAAEATPGQLAAAIVAMVEAGASIINLSLGVITDEITRYRDLDAACDHAASRGVLLVAASGNQGRIGLLPLLNHPWVMPVAACDLDARVTRESNIGPSIGTRGVLAAGVSIPSTSPGGGYAPVSGTSIAAAIVSGALALLRSEFPRASGVDIRRLALDSASRIRRSIIPPLFNAESTRLRLSKSTPTKGDVMEIEDRQGAASLADEPVTTVTTQTLPRKVSVAAPRNGPSKPYSTRPQGRVTVQPGSCPTCAAGATAGVAEGSGVGGYIYAIGTIRAQFPSPGVEKEFAQTVAEGQTTNLSDRQVIFNGLKAFRHLANEMCWVFSVEGVDTYILVPRDTLMLDEFVQAVAPVDRRLDVDVIIGTRGPVAPAEACNGLAVPIVIVDRLYSFNRDELMKALEKPPGSDMTEEAFRDVADGLFDRIQLLADNVGATDEHRALNYLAVRYRQIYHHTNAMNESGFSLTGVQVLPSSLSSTRKLVEVVFTYTNRSTDVEEKYAVRVDVTEKYPFLDRKLSPYYDR